LSSLATIELRLDLRGNPHLGMHLGFCDPRRRAVEIVHTRRFSAVDLLQDYYKNVDLFFEENLSYELQHLSGEIEVDINNIKAKIHELRPIIRKIDRRFGYALIDSFNSLAKFVVMSSKSPLDGLRFFVFPDILEKETGKAIE
jgi:hypothetical protein